MAAIHDDKNEINTSHIEQVDTLATMDVEKSDAIDKIVDKQVDAELSNYASKKAVVIDEETNRRLKRMIDRRILPVMIGTYFLQALDKGTLSFASIMGIQKDTHLVGQQYSWLTTCKLFSSLAFCIAQVL